MHTFHRIGRILLFALTVLAFTGTSVRAQDAVAKMKPGDAKLNLNTTPREAFMAVPDVGQRMAREFDEYRPYISILQFRREIEKYVDAEQVAAFEQYVFVPIKVNDCDAATLQQIPEVDEAKASALMEGRPYASNAAFLTALGEHVSAGAVEVAATYLDN